MTSLDTTTPSNSQLQRSLTTLGINERGATALAAAFDDVETIIQQPPDELATVDGVGPTTVDEVEELQPDLTAFDPRDLIDGDVIRLEDYDVELSAVEIPEGLPTSQEKRAIETAERLLKRANRLAEVSDCGRIGHHEDIRTSLGQWVDDHEGTAEDPGFWRKCVYSMGPGERNRGDLRAPNADTPREEFEIKHQKAQTIHAWASDTFSADAVIDEISDLEERWRSVLREAAEAVADERAGREMRESPPDEINGWERITAQSDAFALAYEGWSQGTSHAVVAAYRDSEGVFQVDEFAYPDWIVRGYDPQGGRENKRLRFDHPENADEAATELRDHLESWNGTADHDTKDYPDDVNGWLLSYVDEENLGKIEYLEPGEGESLTADYAEESDQWWTQYTDPDNNTTDLECVESVKSARESLLRAATQMMAVQGGGTVANHREVARNLHRFDEGEEATDPLQQFDPPVHIGQLWRKHWTPDQNAITYLDRENYYEYKLLWDGSYNVFWVQRVGSSGHRNIPDPRETIYGTEVEGIDAESGPDAVRQMVEFLAENVANFETPEEINGWYLHPDAASINYQSPDGAGLLYVESHGDGTFSAVGQRDAGPYERIASHVDKRKVAVEAIKKFAQDTDPDGWGLRGENR